ncbi:hypothetical protein [Aquabacterium sp.]|uniref:hypothetical protein n=1 Tax=Aquabacterium sp. TaxID=1872578 RepID=UPI002BB5867B|nr:hypothetical protein [Aquabacterium sp.]HSW03332.1 hypothetical protein [Aquabacterium sp.]
MASLTASIQESIEAQREQEWRRLGVAEADIAGSRSTGIDARDITTLRKFSLAGMLLVLRCPKVTARAHHGIFPPKLMAVKEKTGSSGLVVNQHGDILVSDYDLMSVWRQAGAGWQKVFISAANGASRGAWSAEATLLVRSLNQQLVSRLQHGCQDDFQSALNPGVKPGDHFAAFRHGALQHLPQPAACRAFYVQQRLHWPYDPGGHFTGAAPA